MTNNQKNVAKVSVGTIIGQLASIISLPFITRIYGSEIIGTWTLVNSISALIMTVSDLGLMQSVMMEDENNLGVTYHVISQLNLLLSLMASSVVLIYCKLIAKYDWNMTIVVMFFVLVFGVTAQQVLLNYTVLNRNKEYTILMKNPIINQVSVAVISILLGIIGFKSYGYFIGVTMGQILTLLHMQHKIPYSFQLVNLKKIKSTIIRNKHFVCYQTPVNITLSARDQFPNLIMGALYGNATLGYFSISQKLLNIPITFIGQSIGLVFYQRCAEMKRKGKDIADFFYRNLRRALILAIIPMMLLAAFGDAAIVIFFGSEYSAAGTIVRIVVFKSFFTFVSISNRSIDIILDKQQYSMFSCLAQTIFVSLSVVISYLVSNNIIVCALMMTISFIVIQIVYYCAICKAMEISVVYYLRDIIISLIVILIASWALRHLFITIADFTNISFLKLLKSFLYNWEV